MNLSHINFLKNTISVRLLSLLGFIFIFNIGFGQCYKFEGQALTFHAVAQNPDTSYSTIYVLTDYQGNILSTSPDTSFGLQPKGLYNIYGVNCTTQTGLDSLLIGSGIDSLGGLCFDISLPFEALVCLHPDSTCQTSDGTYTFQSAGGNPDFTTVYVLTDVQKTILQISDTTYFAGIAGGEFLIFPINYSDINDLVIGANMTNLSGLCYQVGNPILIKNCSSCYVNAGSDIDLCESQNVIIAAMGSGAGTYTWSNGETGTSIQIMPDTSIHLTVTLTDSLGCVATDDIYIQVLGSPVADAGEDQTINCGGQTILSAVGVRDASYAWSGGQTSQSITVSPQQTTTYYVAVTNGDCFAVDDVTVVVIPINEPISGDTLICSGQTTTLYACDGTRYVWSTGDTTSFVNVNPTTTQTYTVTVTKSNGCVSISAITIHVNICGKIGDLVWEDINGNGTKETDEPGIANVEIILFKEGIQYETTYSDPTGMYFFTYLEPGNYSIRFMTPSGYGATARDMGSNDSIDSDIHPLTGLTPTYAVTENYTNYTIDAGYYRRAEIGDLVWEDRNKNGLKDESETGIANIEVRLQGNDGLGNAVNLTTSTDNAGNYLFTNLSPGQYTVAFVKPGEYTFSPRNIGTDETKDSDADPTTGTTSLLTLPSGEQKLWIDAGMYRCGRVGDLVWLDMGSVANVQDMGDTGLDGIVVQLYATSNPIQVAQSTVTYTKNGRAGYYDFEVCDEGSYFVKVVKPEVYNFVTPNAGEGTNDSKISDIIASATNTFMITYGEQITTIDIGFSNKPLPITLLDFAGNWNGDKEVNELHWVTILEINNDYFDIERSYNGAEFEKIGQVAGAGNTLGRQDYKFVDEDITLDGIYRYRLRQVDYDGTESYSKLVHIQVKRNKESTIRLYPNPTFNSSALEVTGGDNKTYELKIYDETGKLHKKVTENNHNGVWKYQMDGSELPRGVYHLLLNIDGKSTALKWIVIE